MRQPQIELVGIADTVPLVVEELVAEVDQWAWSVLALDVVGSFAVPVHWREDLNFDSDWDIPVGVGLVVVGSKLRPFVVPLEYKLDRICVVD